MTHQSEHGRPKHGRFLGGIVAQVFGWYRLLYSYSVPHVISYIYQFVETCILLIIK